MSARSFPVQALPCAGFCHAAKGVTRSFRHLLVYSASSKPLRCDKHPPTLTLSRLFLDTAQYGSFMLIKRLLRVYIVSATH